MPKVTPKHSFLIQSFAFAECILNLQKLEEKCAPEFVSIKGKIFGQAAETVSRDGVPLFGGQGAMLSMFYLLLVFPQELQKNYKSDFGEIDISEAEKIADEKVSISKDTYSKPIPALTHFRNALAHGRVDWSNGNLVIEDQRTRKGGTEDYCAEFSMEALGKILQELNLAMFHFIKSRYGNG